ncbi:ribosome small subunit-dependent GTPase A [Treponema sp. Marseille-Q3903]|uniref:ribosome small subunit-dependent GTPase A n=1 Tax=Treponema sp. Marseille-Q3903 TaxID=2766703 RepID=UPI001651CA91|nr:ribosome small subunit-dependent GTPase A [Treponema sp. Marseille-Q3903]MBC6713152.1 ribosome small subunit-dependent GTPase A [Treponema sp. Marseille-Q3903]
MTGTVIAGTNNLFTVECEDDVIRNCTIKGKVIKTDKTFYNPIAPGDVVEIAIDELDDAKGQVTLIHPRKNTFLRYNVKGNCPQLIASNLDYLILVTTPEEPPFRPRFIDRALAQAEHQGITPVIVCNKWDLAQQMQADGRAEDFEMIERRLNIWEDLGYKVLRLSARTGEGMTEFAEILEDKLSAFVGQSGVGKSSLINVMDNNCVLRTGSLSKKYGRGSHTTTKGTLVHLNLNESLTEGVRGRKANIIDTPGIRRFVLDDIKADELALYFREFDQFLGKCKFGANCKHISEPECAVLKALENGYITQERFDSWMRICEEIRTGSWSD